MGYGHSHFTHMNMYRVGHLRCVVFHYGCGTYQHVAGDHAVGTRHFFMVHVQDSRRMGIFDADEPITMRERLLQFHGVKKDKREHKKCSR